MAKGIDARELILVLKELVAAGLSTFSPRTMVRLLITEACTGALATGAVTTDDMVEWVRTTMASRARGARETADDMVDEQNARVMSDGVKS